MSQVTRVTLTDDLDGSVAAQTVRFALEGVGYEIDLTDEHAGELRDALAPYVAAGRRRTAGRAASAGRAPAVRDYDPQAVRAWAASRKIGLPARGRIPTSVLGQYRTAGY